MDSSRDEAASSIHAVSYKRGGKVRSTGPANLHKNERVIPANKVKRVEKMMRKSKMRLTNKRRSSGRR
jgi:SLT domain-containing protein